VQFLFIGTLEDEAEREGILWQDEGALSRGGIKTIHRKKENVPKWAKEANRYWKCHQKCSDGNNYRKIIAQHLIIARHMREEFMRRAYFAVHMKKGKEWRGERRWNMEYILLKNCANLQFTYRPSFRSKWCTIRWWRNTRSGKKWKKRWRWYQILLSLPCNLSIQANTYPYNISSSNRTRQSETDSITNYWKLQLEEKERTRNEEKWQQQKEREQLELEEARQLSPCNNEIILFVIRYQQDRLHELRKKKMMERELGQSLKEQMSADMEARRADRESYMLSSSYEWQRTPNEKLLTCRTCHKQFPQRRFLGTPSIRPMSAGTLDSQSRSRRWVCH
jgi:hypothetical protein